MARLSKLQREQRRGGRRRRRRRRSRTRGRESAEQETKQQQRDDDMAHSSSSSSKCYTKRERERDCLAGGDGGGLTRERGCRRYWLTLCHSAGNEQELLVALDKSIVPSDPS